MNFHFKEELKLVESDLWMQRMTWREEVTIVKCIKIYVYCSLYNSFLQQN